MQIGYDTEARSAGCLAHRACTPAGAGRGARLVDGRRVPARLAALVDEQRTHALHKVGRPAAEARHQAEVHAQHLAQRRVAALAQVPQRDRLRQRRAPAPAAARAAQPRLPPLTSP